MNLIDKFVENYVNGKRKNGEIGVVRQVIIPNNKIFERKDYRRLNILNTYRTYNGYVQKVLFIYNRNDVCFIEGEYYNDRERTEVPVLEGDLLLVSKYTTESKEYKLVQVDYNFFGGIKELITNQDKMVIIKYLIDNELVYINPKEDKQPQIDSSYVKFIIASVDQEQVSNENNMVYTLEQFREVLKKNILYKKKKYTLDELLANRDSFENENHELDDILLIARRSLKYSDEIFKVAKKDQLTLEEIKTHVAVCEYNYIYNL